MNGINIDEAYRRLDVFLELSKEQAKAHPFMVVMLMHEYFRNLYPDDPWLRKKYADNHLENVIRCLDLCINSLSAISGMASYFTDCCRLDGYVGDYESEEQFKTQLLYGKLWDGRKRQNTLNSTRELKDSFEMNGFDLNYISGKRVLDIGCGSGRFTVALASMGAEHVTGVDLGIQGLEIGREMASDNGLDNVTFDQCSVLDLPYADESYDFVFCKGVLHHTGNINGGLDELHRVLKSGCKAFLYLYGSGGLFWDSRNKMRNVMQLIPIDYSIKVLELIGMPSLRTVFIDSWYVPIEEHVKSSELEDYLNGLGFSKIQRWRNGRSIELESAVFGNVPNSKELWGEGELRYTLEK